jgi:phage repressor protein C with HTH and peptisase S24 domain
MNDSQIFKILVDELINNKLVKTVSELAAKLPYDQGYLSKLYNNKDEKTLNLKIRTLLNEKFNVDYNPDVDFKKTNNVDECIPILAAKAAASDLMMYGDFDKHDPVGYIKLKGYEDCKFAIPVWGHSMYPTMESGTLAICKQIKDKHSFVFGEIYYIEWGDYRMVKRILIGDSDDEIILYSDNDKELLRGKPKYAPIVVRKNEIINLYLVKGTNKQINH